MSEINTEKIIKDIQSYIDNDVTYIDALVEYAEREGLEIEVLGEIIRRSPVLKSRIYDEAINLNMVEKIARLPV